MKLYQYRYRNENEDDPGAYNVDRRLEYVKSVTCEPGEGDYTVATTDDATVALIIEALLHDAVHREQATDIQYSYRSYLGKCECTHGCGEPIEGPLEWNDMEDR
jgi:hypothetical protein